MLILLEDLLFLRAVTRMPSLQLTVTSVTLFNFACFLICKMGLIIEPQQFARVHAKLQELCLAHGEY